MELTLGTLIKMAKCTSCNLCLDIVWVNNKRFFRCWLCGQYYTSTLESKVLIPVSQEEIDAEARLASEGAQ